MERLELLESHVSSGNKKVRNQLRREGEVAEITGFDLSTGKEDGKDI